MMDAGNRRILRLSSEPQLVLWVTDDDELIIDGVNDEFVELSNFSRSELNDRSLRELAVEPDAFPEQTIVSKIRNRIGEQYLFEVRRPGDISYEMALNVVPQGDRYDPPRVGLTYASDHTAWKLWRSARTDMLSGAWDPYTFRLFLHRTIRRAHRLDRPFGVIDVQLYDCEVDEESVGIRNQVYHDLADRIRQCLGEEDVLARRLEDVFTVIRPDLNHGDRSLEAVCRDLRVPLADPIAYHSDLYDFEWEITWCEYPEQSNAVENMLGYEHPLVA